MQRTFVGLFVLAFVSVGPLGCGQSNGNGDSGHGSGMDTGTATPIDSGADAASDAFATLGDTGNGNDMDGGHGGGDDTGNGGSDDTGTGTDTGTGGGTDTGTGGGTDSGTGTGGDGGGFSSLGMSCTGDSQCASGRCARITPGSGEICVTPCTSHTDCSVAGTYCAPTSEGGVCAPHDGTDSTLCAACTTDAECGVLSQVCAMGPGDTANACHTDCSLDAAACPSGYSCVASGSRHICHPTSVTCHAALGCGGASTCASNQMCCTGTCEPIDTATSCGGCGTHCGSGEGCCGMSCRLLNTMMNCGACGNVCLGNGMHAVATCNMGTCILVCQGEQWDANGNAADGCETADSVPPGHTAAAATAHGSFNACDAASMDSFSGHIVSDNRLHLPSVSGLDLALGSTPDYWTVTATGAPPTDTGVACTNDLSATITTTGGSSTGTCYRLIITGGTATYMTDVSGSGSATITQASPAYSAGATLTFEIVKTCSNATHENMAYTVSYHL